MLKQKRTNNILINSFFCLITIVLAISCTHNKEEKSSDEKLEQEVNHTYAYGICVDSLSLNYHIIKNGDYLSSILIDLGFTGNQAEEITQTITPFYPPSKLQIGNTYATVNTKDSTSSIQYLVFEQSKTDFVVVDLTSDSLIVNEGTKPITLKRKYAEGTIKSSLWNAIVESGSSPMLALKLSDLYAWQVDFFGIKKGDSFRMFYDEAWVDDTTFLDIASIEGVVFNHHDREYVAIPFQQDSTREYFDEEGKSLRKQFLKNPLDFFRISSRFSNSRFHPVLKRYRAHHGVDYAAPTGTPVKTIGDGVVIAKAYQRNGGGNYLKVKHNSVYTTTYMHLSKFAKGIKRGSTVKQGQIIAYVGSTGLSTGPHLDFRVHKNNQPIDPLKMEAPPSYPVKTELMDSFMIARDKVLMELDSLHNSFNIIVNETDSLKQNERTYTQSL